jgi:hypothetical protein
MVLWTDPESQHCCIVCDQQNIHSGYKCNKCWDYDFCDMCTARPGRLAVQKGMSEEKTSFGVLHEIEHFLEKAEMLRENKGITKFEKYLINV